MNKKRSRRKSWKDELAAKHQEELRKNFIETTGLDPDTGEKLEKEEPAGTKPVIKTKQPQIDPIKDAEELEEEPKMDPVEEKPKEEEPAKKPAPKKAPAKKPVAKKAPTKKAPKRKKAAAKKAPKGK